MMDMQFEADTPPANIKVIGVGGGGGNAVQNMIDGGPEGCLLHLCQYGCAGSASLQKAAEIKLQIGEKLTKGSWSRGRSHAWAAMRRRKASARSRTPSAMPTWSS